MQIWWKLGFTRTVEEQVLRLARLTVDAGCKGLVASTLETKTLRHELPKDIVIVTPGIQLDSGNPNDQKRVASPRAAVEAGSSFFSYRACDYESTKPKNGIC